MKVTDWLAANAPRPEMYYATEPKSQCDHLTAMADQLGVPVEIVESHRSKSVDLPVARFDFGAVSAYWRNNFHDVKIVVDGDVPLDLPYEVVGHIAISAAELADKKKRAYDYMVGNPVKHPEEIGAFYTDAWYTKYAGGLIHREGDGIWLTSRLLRHVYFEGIGRLPLREGCFDPYLKGKSRFGAEPRGENGDITLLRAIQEALSSA